MPYKIPRTPLEILKHRLAPVAWLVRVAPSQRSTLSSSLRYGKIIELHGGVSVFFHLLPYDYQRETRETISILDSMDWFKGNKQKTGNQRFSHEDLWGFPVDVPIDKYTEIILPPSYGNDRCVLTNFISIEKLGSSLGHFDWGDGMARKTKPRPPPLLTRPRLFKRPSPAGMILWTCDDR